MKSTSRCMSRGLITVGIRSNSSKENDRRI